MQFDENKPIYVQIAEGFYEKILSGAIKEGDRIESVREFGAKIGVNPNTVVRAYDILTENGVIFNKRGIGFFICEDAKAQIIKAEQQAFLQNEWPRCIKKAELLGLNPKKLLEKL